MTKHPMADCDNCPLNKTGQFVPAQRNGHSPDNPAKFVFVGEAPGKRETRDGIPFTGMSGKLLDALLEGHGISRKDAVLTNTCLCRPKGNATPDKRAVEACSGALKHEIANASPEYVIAMGNTAASAVLGKNVKITQERVGPPKTIEGKPYKVVPTIHPAATLRNTGMFPKLDRDIGKLVRTNATTWVPPKYKIFEQPKLALSAIKQLQIQYDKLVIDIEAGTDKDEDFSHPSNLLCIGLGYEVGKVAVIGYTALQDQRVRRELSQLLKTKKLVGQNLKYDLQVLHDLGFGFFKPYADTMLKSYTQDEMKGVHGLKYRGQEELGTPDWSKEFHDKYGSWEKIAEAVYEGNEDVKEALYRYNAYDVAVTWDLDTLFDEWMDEEDRKLHEFLCWVSPQIMLIESEGVKLNRKLLQELDVQMQGEVSALNKELQQIAKGLIARGKVTDEDTLRLVEKNGRFNPNSHVQVKGVLSALLGGGTVLTTEADFLQSIVDSKGVETGAGYFCHLMLEQRSVAKMHGTYVKGWMRRMDENDRIRTSYLLHGTETGRLSARNPNVQNPPREGFRQVVVADEGNIFLYADFGNIEGRIVAVESGDENMLDVFRDPKRDIHGEVASMIFGMDFDKEQRVKAKTVVHGKNYARTPDGIASDPELGLAISEARKISRAYDGMFPRVIEWQKDIKRRIIKEGETLITPWGRKRRFGLITRENAEDVYKEALAFTPQSIGSDICLTAAVRLKEMGYTVRIVIHDGILIEVRAEEAEAAIPIIRRVMEDAAKEYTTIIPFPVDIEVGTNWGDVH